MRGFNKFPLLFGVIALFSMGSAHAVGVMQIKTVWGGRCLDVSGGNTANRTPIQIWDCNGTAAQRWWMSMGNPDGVGTDLDKNKALDAPYTTDYSQVWLFDWWRGDNQKWSVPQIELRIDAYSGKCVTIAGSGWPDEYVKLADCNGNVAQKWFYDSYNRQIRSKKDGRCLGIGAGVPHTSIPFAGVHTNCQEDSYNITWTIYNSMMFVSWDGTDQMCMNPYDGTWISFSPCNGSNSQQFFARGNLVGYQSGKCLQIPAGSGSNGNWNGWRPELYTCNGTIPQQWDFRW